MANEKYSTAVQEAMAYNEIKVELTKKEKVLKVGHPADVKEKIEDMLCKRLGFYPALQENVEDGQYQLHLHTEDNEELDEEQELQLEKLRITDDEETTTEAIKRFLQVEFRIVEESL